MYPAYPSYTPGASNTGMINPQNRQTHAGFPYCYDLLDTNGAFTEVNTRYQGPSPAYDYYSTASTNPIYGGAGGSANLTTAAPGVLPAPSALQPYQTQIQAKLLIDPVDNAPGFVPLGLNYQITVTFVDTLQADGNSLGFTNATEAATCLSGTMGDSGYYNIGAMQHTFLRQTNSSGQYELNFVSQPVVVGGATGTDPTGQTFQFSGGRVTLTIQPVDQAGVAIGTAQTINLNFPAATFPTPLLAIQPPGINTYNDFAANSWANFPPQNIYDLTPSWMLTFDADPTTSVNPFAPLSTNPNFGTGSTSLYPAGWSRFICPSNNGNYNNSPAQYLFMPQWPLGVLPTDKVGYFKLTADTVRSLEAAYGDTRVIAALQNVPSSFFVPHKYYYDTTMRSAHSFRSNGKLMRSTFDAFSQGSTATLLTNALQLNPSAVNFYYYNYVWFGKPTTATQEIQNVVVGIPVGNGSEVGSNGVSSFAETTSMCDFNNSDPYWTSNTSWAALPKFSTIWANGGDFDNGPDHEGDGPFINKPDEGFDTNVTSTYNLYYPAYEEQNYQSYGTGLFPPNRQVSSPVLFGSLPVILDKSVTSLSNLTPSNAFFWRTLLFSPNPNSQTHPSVITQAPNLSAGTYTYTPNPPDFTSLDFFNMPVVEPYAISEPFSTAGRVNMNYQIAPFTYIKRDTAMRGVLRSTMMTAVPDSWIYYYKSSANGGTFGDNGGPFDKQSAATGYFNFRYPISPTQTLMQFDAKFANGDIFRSPSEISSIWLYPAMQATASAPTNPATPLVTYDSASQNIQNWWYSNPGNTADLTGQQCRKSLTGTNMRDRPYADIYPQLTTKSNSYTVHYRVQVLKKIPTTPANEWIENQDQIYSEYRGSSLIERYIDPNNTSIPDFATTYPTSIQGNATPQALDNYYYYHVLSVRKFSP
jgi:uncharacterized protein (TIGR02600 family)